MCKSCKDNCKYYNVRWEVDWCDRHEWEIVDKTRPCTEYIEDSKFHTFLKWVGLV